MVWVLFVLFCGRGANLSSGYVFCSFWKSVGPHRHHWLASELFFELRLHAALHGTGGEYLPLVLQPSTDGILASVLSTSVEFCLGDCSHTSLNEPLWPPCLRVGWVLFGRSRSVLHHSMSHCHRLLPGTRGVGCPLAGTLSQITKIAR